MSQSYMSYYDRYAWRALPRFLLDAFCARRSLRRLSILNHYRDYLGLARSPELLALHRKLNELLLASAQTWDSYDYGEGYFYQSLPRIGVSGLRDTAARVQAMGLREKLAGKRVLEIGCNSGFVALSVADVAEEVIGFDINPHLIGIAREAAAYLRATNAHFDVCTFEEFTATGDFDVVLSFANHCTYDGNTRQSVQEYFTKCRNLIAPGGLLLFESHTPDYEGDGLAGVIEVLGRTFRICEQRVLNVGTFLDRGRTFIVARRDG